MSTPTTFALTEEQELFRKAVREFAESKIAPRAAEIDETDEFPWDIHASLVEQGYMGVGFPEEFGGAGGGPLDVCILAEEISRVSAGVSLIHLVNRLGAIPVLIAGTEAQKREASEGISSGKHQYSYCLTEPGSGSDAAAMASKAIRDGDGWRINGSKRFITNAGISDRYLYFAVTDPEGDKGKNVTAFLIHDDAEGFSLGKSERKMGIRGSPTREVNCDNVWVPDSQVVGEVNQGFQIAMRTLDYSRPTIAAQALGIAQGALDESVRYVKEREQFGQAIARFEGIQFMVADMAMAIEASRLLTYKAAALITEGDPDIGYFAAIAKAFASDTAMKVTTDAVQLLGGYGYIKEFPVERMMRDAKITQIYEGTNQIQRVVIGRKILK
ncbi:MAG TPA: acyl-CoA dehydrogenase family protein [Actinomycetota bacterium]|nr:acyl-CoA dehydrogenase family protein [Actinomycetota bacterium]